MSRESRSKICTYLWPLHQSRRCFRTFYHQSFIGSDIVVECAYTIDTNAALKKKQTIFKHPTVIKANTKVASLNLLGTSPDPSFRPSQSWHEPMCWIFMLKNGGTALGGRKKPTITLPDSQRISNQRKNEFERCKETKQIADQQLLDIKNTMQLQRLLRGCKYSSLSWTIELSFS